MRKRGKVFRCSADKVRVVRTLNAKYPERKGARSDPEECEMDGSDGWECRGSMGNVGWNPLEVPSPHVIIRSYCASV